MQPFKTKHIQVLNLLVNTDSNTHPHKRSFRPSFLPSVRPSGRPSVLFHLSFHLVQIPLSYLLRFSSTLFHNNLFVGASPWSSGKCSWQITYIQLIRGRLPLYIYTHIFHTIHIYKPSMTDHLAYPFPGVLSVYTRTCRSSKATQYNSLE